MTMPIETNPALWGIACGAVAVAVLGFSVGGWVTGGNAQATARVQSDRAVVDALAPVCVARFQHGATAAGTLVALRRIDSESRGDFIEKGGWATVPGDSTPERNSAVATACAALLAKG